MNKKVPNKKVLHPKKKPSSRNTSTKASNNKKGNNIGQVILIIVITSIVVSIITSIINKTDFSFSTKNKQNQYSEPQNENIPESTTPDNTQSKQTNSTDASINKDNKEVSSEEQSDEKPAPDNINITLFFIKLSEDGEPTLIEKKRSIEKNPAILTASLTALLQGPNSQEQAEDLVSYIPKGSTLRQASVKNGVAFLDFNDAFQFNEYGNAGILAQLFQIVYTSTHLPNISSVQITIEGKRVSYLGGEGTIEVNKPITRDYLNNF